MKLLHLLIAGLALIAAGLQFNDPDPVYWVVAYTATALVVAARGFDRQSRFWTAIVMGIAVGGMLWSVTGLGEYLLAGDLGAIIGGMSPDRPYVEETREFLGLAMSLAALVWVYRR